MSKTVFSMSNGTIDNLEKPVEIIADFYLVRALLETNDLEKAYSLAEKYIQDLRITKLEYCWDEDIQRNKITIILQRPGLLIGKKGSNVEALSRFSKCFISIIEDDSKNIENNIISTLYSRD